ncbi:MAG: hypothetical protein ABJL99_09460 [Aliishimia sp.]
MRQNKRKILGLFFSTVCCFVGASLPLYAQSSQANPLSAIDWLTKNTPQTGVVQPVAQPAPTISEPPIARSGSIPEVTVAPLGAATQRRLGLLPFSVTGLPAQMWTGSDAASLSFALRNATSQRIPAAQELILMLMLAEADDLRPEAAGLTWLEARVDALMELGAIEPALSLVQQADPIRSKSLFSRWLTLALLAKQEAAPCAALVETPRLAPDETFRIYCTARNGDFDTASLLFGTAAALDLLPSSKETLLARFLDPDLFEDEAMPRAPVRPDALTFRLFEAAGEPLSTAPLPRAFAHADLSEDAGWKAQLEAAERLARAGVLPSNKLLGLYSDRDAAASGGIWDRVDALQDFEAALQDADPGKVSNALPAMWRGMQAARLEVVFSDLFAQDLAKLTLDGPAANIAHRMELLSRSYETAPLPVTPDKRARYLASVAIGEPDANLADTEMANSVANAFGPQSVPSPGLREMEPTNVGAALLQVLKLLADAGRGDLSALQTALTDLRALGLEDMARRVALQMLILKDRG